MRYAVNLCDLTEIRGPNPLVLQVLLADFITAKPPIVNTDPRVWDASAVVLDGPAAQDPQRTQALVDLLQRIIGPRKLKRRIRCYAEGPRGGWSEIRPNERPLSAAPKKSEAAMKTATLPDYTRFANLGLCPCPWRGENDHTCREFVHMIHRFPGRNHVPARLQGFHYGATNGHALHLWQRENHVPDLAKTREASEDVLESFACLLPREGIEITVERDPILQVLPTNGKVRANHMIAFRATLAGDAEWTLLKPLEDDPLNHEELPPQFQRTAMQTFHCLSARLVWNAFQGTGPTLRMWLPTEPGRPVTLEGEGTRALIMPMRDNR